MSADEIDRALAESLGLLPDGWTFHGVRPDGGTGWQAMAWRVRDNAWANGLGTTAGAAVAALVSGDVQVVPRLHPEDVEPRHHTTIDVVLDGEPTAIDSELAPLIEAIRDAGLVTISSCQSGLGGKSIIDFDSVEDAAVFLAIAATDFSLDLESLWNRMFVEDEPDDWEAFRRDRMWKVHAGMHDYSLVFEDPDAENKRLVRLGGGASIDFGIGVEFPPTDIPALVELVKIHNTATATSSVIRHSGVVEAG